MGKLTHGYSHTPEHDSWLGLKTRCFNPRDSHYENYGARGITVHADWINDFPAFLAHVGKRPGPGYSIDRYPDNNGNYEPGNVRWSNSIDQNNNRRCNLYLSAYGRRQTVSQWARETDIHFMTIRNRLRKGLSPEECLSKTHLARRRKQSQGAAQ